MDEILIIVPFVLSNASPKTWATKNVPVKLFENTLSKPLGVNSKKFGVVDCSLYTSSAVMASG